MPHVEFERYYATPECFDLCLKLRKGITIPAGKNQIRARPRQSACELLAESATGSGDDGYSPGEIEEPLVGRILVHKSVPGVRTTFIRLGSRA